MADGVFPPTEREQVCRSCHKLKGELEFEWHVDGRMTKTCRSCLAEKRTLNKARARTGALPELEPKLGKWTLIPGSVYRHIGSGRSEYRIRATCVCGYVGSHPVSRWSKLRVSNGCVSCVVSEEVRARYAANDGPARYSSYSKPLPRPTRPGRTPEQQRRDTLPWAEDAEAHAFVAEHPEGAKLEEVGAWFGLTRERIRQIETVALRKLRQADLSSGHMRDLLHALVDRDHGPRNRGTGIARHALSWDELPTLVSS